MGNIKRNDTIIETLVKELTPVKPVSSLAIRGARWWILSLVLSAMGLLMMPLRDMGSALQSPSFVATGIWLMVTAAFATHALSELTIPGKNSARRRVLVSLTLFGLGLLALIAEWFTQRTVFHPGIGLECSIGTMGLSLLPFGVLLFLLKRGATTSPIRTGALSGLMVGAVSAVILSFSCANDQPIHLLVWHIGLPTLVLAATGAVLGRFVLKW